MSSPLPELKASMSRLGMGPPSEDLLRGVASYIRELEKWRSAFNLMGSRAGGELIRLHFLEAFWAAERFLEGGETLADIGSGAGFPGLALKLYRPALRITLLERTFKKCVFLNSTARRLGLEVSVWHGAAEAWDGWGTVDFASVRAVRLSPRLLAPLERAGVALLRFRGADSEALPDPWTLAREEAYPDAANRWVGLYRARLRND